MEHRMANRECAVEFENLNCHEIAARAYRRDLDKLNKILVNIPNGELRFVETEPHYVEQGWRAYSFENADEAQLIEFDDISECIAFAEGYNYAMALHRY